MKKILLLILLAFGLHTQASANEIRDELPIGTTFSIKTDFWVYRIKWRPPYEKNNHYLMSTNRAIGLGGMKFKYLTTLPEGTRLEVVSLVKKSERVWVYLVKTKGYTVPEIGEATIAISPVSMLEEPWGVSTKFAEQPTKTLKLNPEFFIDFIYPDKE